MTRDQAKQEIRGSWRTLINDLTQPAKRKVNGETSYICPICGHGKSGDGLAENPKNPNMLKCFGCDFSGDIFDLYSKTTGAGFADTFNLLAGKLGITIDGKETTTNHAEPKRGGDLTAEGEAEKKPRKTVDYSGYYKLCEERLEGSKEAQAYLDSRGVLSPALYYGLGFDPQADPAKAPGATGNENRPHPAPRIIIPCGSSFYIGRRIDSDKYKAINSPGEVMPFNDSVLYAHDVQEVFITEGVFDALSIIEAGGQAVALHGTGHAAALARKLEANPTAATLILALDNDAAGQRETEKLAAELTRINTPFILSDICSGHKDPNEALTADRAQFYDAVQSAIQDAQTDRENRRKQAEQELLERQQRTGAEMVDRFLETIQTRKYEPIPTGISDIDQAIGGGLIRQQLVLLGAAPGAGKTALTQWIFEGMAKRGSSCVFINLEMSKDQLLARSIARLAADRGEPIKPTDILQGYKWDVAQEAVVYAAAEEYKSTIAPRTIYNPDTASNDLDSILEYIEAEATRAEAAGLEAPLVVVDYLQIIIGRDREDETQVIKRALAGLKSFAVKHNTVVFAITANNRTSNRTGTVTMESGRGTSALEYGADLQLGLSFTACMEDKSKDAEDLTTAERQRLTLHVTKGRWAEPRARADLFFNGVSMRFTQTEWKRTAEPAKKKPAYII